ncbi:hypothetical protein EVAR_92749_1 [Eumeta japonica]|uniref:Uncharacterized protein n=1 Tax=Eumeta variegata TaxID=151549 RepID=A0A4C1SZY9_EUMVA|nr:hypothetical protein EVAR_92749_1 [Eumeta japonica]
MNGPDNKCKRASRVTAAGRGETSHMHTLKVLLTNSASHVLFYTAAGADARTWPSAGPILGARHHDAISFTSRARPRRAK